MSKKDSKLKRNKINIKALQNHVIDSIIKCTGLEDKKLQPQILSQENQINKSNFLNIKSIKDLPQLMAYYRNLMIKTVKRRSTIASKQTISKRIERNRMISVKENNTMTSFFSQMNSPNIVKVGRNFTKLHSSLENPITSSLNYDKEEQKTFHVQNHDDDKISTYKFNCKNGLNLSSRKSSFITASLNDGVEDEITEESSKNIFKKHSKLNMKKRQVSFLVTKNNNQQIQNYSVQFHKSRLPSVSMHQSPKFAF